MHLPYIKFISKTKIIISATIFTILLIVALICLIVWLLKPYGGVNAFVDGAKGSTQHSISGSNGVFLLMVKDTRNAADGGLLSPQPTNSRDPGRTDAMILARIFSDNTLHLVSIPRDTYVHIPSCTRSDGTVSDPLHTKINAAYAQGAAAFSASPLSSAAGMKCAQRTVENLTGLKISGAITLDSKGIELIVDQLGGVELCPTDDHAAAFAGLHEGCQVVDGRTAFKFAQTRLGVDDSSDISRIERQHQLFRAVSNKLSAVRFPQGLPRMIQLAHGLGSHISSTPNVVNLSNTRALLSAVSNSQPVLTTMPWTLHEDGINVVPLPEATAIWEQFGAGRMLASQASPTSSHTSSTKQLSP